MLILFVFKIVNFGDKKSFAEVFFAKNTSIGYKHSISMLKDENRKEYAFFDYLYCLL